jgi:hypothetical protein
MNLHEGEVPAPLISIIVPSLNEKRAIDRTLRQIMQAGSDIETIVVDGGSSDGTSERLERAPVRVLRTRPGRGHQLDFGAAAARGTMFWFLLPGTLITAEAVAMLRTAACDPSILSGNFGLVFDGGSRPAKILTWTYRRLRPLGLCYGESGFFVRADVYHHVGGFRDLPRFEDLDLLWRLERAGKFVRLPAVITMSSRRYEKPGFALRFTRWIFLQLLFGLGFNPAPRRSRAEEGSREPALLLVYNTDSGFLDILVDAVRQLFSISQQDCRLHSLTHGLVRMHPEWADFLVGLGPPVEFRHRDEFFRKHPELRIDLPAVLYRRGRAIRTLIGGEEIRSCASMAQLEDLLRQRIPTAAGPTSRASVVQSV